VVFELCEWTDRQTDRQTDIFITIFCTAPGWAVIRICYSIEYNQTVVVNFIAVLKIKIFSGKVAECDLGSASFVRQSAGILW